MKKRREFIALSVGLGIGIFLPNQLTAAKSFKPMIVHQVFFWLKNPKTDFTSVIEGCKAIGKLKSAHSYQVGVPAPTPKREVIEDSYHIALTVNFKSLADHDLYQVDPVHLEFIADHGAKWEKVQIFDFELK